MTMELGEVGEEWSRRAKTLWGARYMQAVSKEQQGDRNGWRWKEARKSEKSWGPIAPIAPDPVSCIKAFALTVSEKCWEQPVPRVMVEVD